MVAQEQNGIGKRGRRKESEDKKLMKVLGVRIPEALYEEYREYCRKRGSNPSVEMRRFIIETLEKAKKEEGAA